MKEAYRIDRLPTLTMTGLYQPLSKYLVYTLFPPCLQLHQQNHTDTLSLRFSLTRLRLNYHAVVCPTHAEAHLLRQLFFIYNPLWDPDAAILFL
jgi:hypothetical protein